MPRAVSHVPSMVHLSALSHDFASFFILYKQIIIRSGSTGKGSAAHLFFCCAFFRRTRPTYRIVLGRSYLGKEKSAGISVLSCSNCDATSQGTRERRTFGRVPLGNDWSCKGKICLVVAIAKSL